MTVAAARVGLLALQGGVAEHRRLLEALDAAVVPIRRPADLIGPDGSRIDALVLPGGESSTIDRLARLFELTQPLSDLIEAGLPTLGTCAGLIMLASEIADPAPDQGSLGVLDVTVRRNAWGRQLASAEVDLATPWGNASVAFIRAPGIERVGPGVDVLARHRGDVVAVAQQNIIGLAFHPELTGETLFHRRLLADARGLADTA